MGLSGSSGSPVSVVIGTYNGERFLRTQLDTVLQQTLLPREVIVTDDGSTDGTVAIAEEYASRSSVPVHVVRNPVNLGFADNFLSGARLATGRWVAFCDQDDVWRADKLEVCVTALERHDAVLCVHAVDIIDEDGVQLVAAERRGADAVLEPLAGDPWKDYFGFTMVVDRRLLDLIPADQRGPDTHRPDTPLSHDRWVWILASGLGRVVLVDEVLASYRRHGSQLFGSIAGRSGRLRDLRGWLGHVVRGLSRVPERVHFLAGVCQRRAELMDDITAGSAAAAGLDGRAGTRAATLWRQLATANARRRQLYAVPRARRPVALALSVLAGVYREPCEGGCGVRFLAQDVLALLVVPPTGMSWAAVSVDVPPDRPAG